MKLNLRTVLILVILTTSLSIIYQQLIVQIALIGFTLLLYLLTGLKHQALMKVLHRLSKLGQIILTLMIFQILFSQGGDIYWQFGFIKITSVGLNYGIISSLRSSNEIWRWLFLDAIMA